MGVSSLAQVLTGWTGTVSAHADGSTVTITPHTRESVASLLARVVHEFTLKGFRPAVSVSDLGVVTLGTTHDPMPDDFTLTGLCATWTGFTSGPYTGGIYPADAAFAGGFMAAYGMRLADPLVATTRGQSTMYGSAATSPARRSGRSTLYIYDDNLFLGNFGNSDYDLWHDGRIQGRFRIDETRRVPLSRTLRSNTTTRLECDVEEVA